MPVVKGVATYTARYEAVDWTPEYTITFKDGDNKVLTTQTARLNVVPEYAGVTPTKAATAQYTYTFNNTWSPAIVAATKNETYTAQFDSELRSYTITFCNETGRELSSATFDYGATPVYGGEMPKKARTGSAVYTFDGWSSTMGGQNWQSYRLLPEPQRIMPTSQMNLFMWFVSTRKVMAQPLQIKK